MSAFLQETGCRFLILLSISSSVVLVQVPDVLTQPLTQSFPPQQPRPFGSSAFLLVNLPRISIATRVDNSSLTNTNLGVVKTLSRHLQEANCQEIKAQSFVKVYDHSHLMPTGSAVDMPLNKLLLVRMSSETQLEAQGRVGGQGQI